MRKGLLAIALAASAGLAVSTGVRADDVPTNNRSSLRDPLPDSLTLGGVTVYGTIDIGYAYQSNGVPLSSKYLGGLEYQSFTTTRNFSGSQSTVAESGREQAKIGVRVELPFGGDFKVIGRAETGFNPLSGQLVDACGSIADNSGVAQGRQTANADSSRCGQAFNSVTYGGVSSKTFGTLTIGRQQSLQLDALVLYDPQTLAYAFSFLGYSGFDAGSGSTEAARWDNSVKYLLNYGPAHAAFMYSNGGEDTGLLNHAYGADVGVTLFGVSVDALYQKENGAVNLRSSFDNMPNPLPSPGLAAYISDDEAWNLMAKYTFDFGAADPAAKPPAGPKLTVFAGYSHITKNHSSDSYGSSQGNYPLSIGININDAAVYNFEWIGAKFALPAHWSFTGAFYHTNQNSWTIGLASTGTDGIGCAGAGLLCAGSFSEASVSVVYAFDKHFDLYAGVNWSEVKDGLANGFVGTSADGTTGSENQTTTMVGGRLRF
jgi:predicted porin